MSERISALVDVIIWLSQFMIGEWKRAARKCALGWFAARPRDTSHSPAPLPACPRPTKPRTALSHQRGVDLKFNQTATYKFGAQYPYQIHTSLRPQSCVPQFVKFVLPRQEFFASLLGVITIWTIPIGATSNDLPSHLLLRTFCLDADLFIAICSGIYFSQLQLGETLQSKLELWHGQSGLYVLQLFSHGCIACQLYMVLPAFTCLGWP